MSAPSDRSSEHSPPQYEEQWPHEAVGAGRRRRVRKVYDRDESVPDVAGMAQNTIRATEDRIRAADDAMEAARDVIRAAVTDPDEAGTDPATDPMGAQGDLYIEEYRVPRSLDPVVVPDQWASPRPRRPLGFLGILGRLGLAAAAAAVVALVLVGRMPSRSGTSEAEARTEASSFVSRFTALLTKGAEHEPAAEPVTAHLVVTAGPPASADRDIPLGLAAIGASDGASLVLAGLPAGTALSSGRALGGTGWRLAAADVGATWVRPPRGFAGPMDLIAELRQPDDTVADRRPLRLEWLEPASARAPAALPFAAVPAAVMTTGTVPVAALPPAPPPPEAPTAPVRMAPAPATALAAAPATTPAEAPVAATPPPGPTVRQLERDEIDMLIRRGQQFLAAGDLAAARVLLQRAAEARDARAALALGATYDPNVLQQLGVRGIVADIGQARMWYERAKEFGSSEAPRRLQALVGGPAR
jgi:hypothetical protein